MLLRYCPVVCWKAELNGYILVPSKGGANGAGSGGATVAALATKTTVKRKLIPSGSACATKTGGKQSSGSSGAGA
eukprot:12886596-Ditylum_brightwellii.AAC.1